MLKGKAIKEKARGNYEIKGREEFKLWVNQKHLAQIGLGEMGSANTDLIAEILTTGQKVEEPLQIKESKKLCF